LQFDRVDDDGRWRAWTAGELAWLALVPCALVLLLALLLLAPPLGHTLLEPSSTRFWRYDLPAVRPEPVERARYLLAVLAPLLFATCLAALPRRRWSRPARGSAAVLGSQGLLIAFLLACIVVQQRKLFGPVYSNLVPQHRAYFTPRALAVALLFAVLVAAAARSPPLMARLARWCRETPIRSALAFAAVLLFTAVWLITGVNTEASIGGTNPLVIPNFPELTDEAFALLNGRYPFVTFHATYGHLWLYPAALAMRVFGASFGVYCGFMVLASGAILLALYATLRRLVKSSLIAFALYAPVLATGFFIELGPPENRYAPSNLFSLFPMRYGGAYVLAWLTARHLDGARPVRRSLLFLVAGLVAANNLEFGLPALAATIAAIVLTMPSRAPAALARLARGIGAGLAGTAVLLTVLTLSVAGSLPHPGVVLTLPRLIGIDGYVLLPMPAFGFHLALYVTFGAAIALAAVRAIERDPDRVLTGMLVWSGVFGLGASSYFSGRSHPDVLIAIFSAWAFALAVLTVATVRALAARSSRWPAPGQLAVLFGFGLAVCSLAQTPTVRPDVDRLRTHATETSRLLRPDEREQFVASATKPGEAVAIFAPLGHRIAYDLGLKDVVDYSELVLVPTPGQWQDAIAALRAAGGRKLFLAQQDRPPEVVGALRRAGFRQVGGTETFRELVATR